MCLIKLQAIFTTAFVKRIHTAAQHFSTFMVLTCFMSFCFAKE